MHRQICPVLETYLSIFATRNSYNIDNVSLTNGSIPSAAPEVDILRINRVGEAVHHSLVALVILVRALHLLTDI